MSNKCLQKLFVFRSRKDTPATDSYQTIRLRRQCLPFQPWFTAFCQGKILQFEHGFPIPAHSCGGNRQHSTNSTQQESNYKGKEMKALATAIIGILMVGSAYGEWNQIGQELIGDEGDMNGTSLSLSSDGTTLAIGAKGSGSGMKGHVRIYKLNGWETSWDEVVPNSQFDNTNYNAGIFVSLSSDGNILAIGNETERTVKMYKYNTGITTWEEKKTISLGSDSEKNIHSLSLSDNGEIVAIGSSKEDVPDSSKRNSGIVRVYKKDNNRLSPRRRRLPHRASSIFTSN